MFKKSSLRPNRLSFRHINRMSKQLLSSAELCVSQRGHFDSGFVMSGYKWVRYTGGRYSTPGMISVGKDKDGSNLVVGRAYHDGDLLPAKVKPEHGIAYISYNMQEIIKRDFEILMPLEFTWIHARNGQIPHGAVPGGHTRAGEQLFIGKVVHDGVPVIGKVHPSHGVLYIPYGNQEVSFREYQVLTQS